VQELLGRKEEGTKMFGERLKNSNEKVFAKMKISDRDTLRLIHYFVHMLKMVF
jgi:hypothetical protein